MGNTGSIINMFNHIGLRCEETSDLTKISEAKKLILPGVGAFDTAMEKINSLGIKEVLDKKVLEEQIPVLGICLGMHLLSKISQEGFKSGLGWMDAKVKKFKPSNKYKVPHMGWNYIKVHKQNPLSQGLESDARFYFVHSYYVEISNQNDLLFETDHAIKFASAINHKNIFGVQFHPEKSHRFGMQLLKNFGEI